MSVVCSLYGNSLCNSSYGFSHEMSRPSIPAYINVGLTCLGPFASLLCPCASDADELLSSFRVQSAIYFPTWFLIHSFYWVFNNSFMRLSDFLWIVYRWSYLSFSQGFPQKYGSLGSKSEYDLLFLLSAFLSMYFESNVLFGKILRPLLNSRVFYVPNIKSYTTMVHGVWHVSCTVLS